MSMVLARRLVAIALLVASLAACEAASLIEGIPDGGRRWVVTVQNDSARPAAVVVAEDDGGAGNVVGMANPAAVPPGQTIDVVLGIPSGRSWAIFLNPGPQRGPIVTPGDAPADAVGKMPFTLHVDRNGEVSATVPDLPGWFGNP